MCDFGSVVLNVVHVSYRKIQIPYSLSGIKQFIYFLSLGSIFPCSIHFALLVFGRTGVQSVIDVTLCCAVPFQYHHFGITWLGLCGQVYSFSSACFHLRK